MGRSEFLRTLDQFLLMAMVRLRREAYGKAIQEELEKRLGTGVNIGMVYMALDRLERRGYIKANIGESTPERGGRAKKYFHLTGTGERALRESLRAGDLMRAGLSFPKGASA
jgi:PadR family transcriptional regulator, regulatory protein PadR